VKLIKKHNKNLTYTAKILRKDMTEQERKLWYNYLKKYPVRILRQKVINRFIVDFYCKKANLVIEIDGSQHYIDENKIYDTERTKLLEGYGLEVIRFSNSDIYNNFAGVCAMIDMEIKKRIQ